MTQNEEKKATGTTTNCACIYGNESQTQLEQDTNLLRFADSPVGTLLPSLTLSLHPEGADVWSVSLVIWCGPGQFQQHITRAGGFTELAHWPGAIRVGYLRMSKQTGVINDNVR